MVITNSPECKQLTSDDIFVRCCVHECILALLHHHCLHDCNTSNDKCDNQQAALGQYIYIFQH